MKSRRFWLSLVGLLAGLALFVAACGPASTENMSPAGAPPAGDVAVPNEAREITELVQQDLAEQQGADVKDVRVVSIEAVNWPDSSLGCPKPGMAYATVVTPGYKIVLAIGEQEHTYHTGTGSFVLCEQENLVKEMEPGDQPAHEVELDATTTVLVEQAQLDLSQRFGISVDSMTLVSVEAVEWPDSSLGCPGPGFNYLQVVTPGYVIRLEADGKMYEYHTDEQNVVYCPGAPSFHSAEAEQRVTSAAEADLAQRLSIAAGEIQVVQIEAVEWPDASLGCPQPGMLYAQVITPGYRVVLSADGQEYIYHTDQGQVILCE